MEALSIKEIREEVKHYIDSADEKIVKMIHAMLEVDADNDWWASLPDTIKNDVEASIKEADNGEVISHDKVRQKYAQWAYEIVWTQRAIKSFDYNLEYLQENWTEQEIKAFHLAFREEIISSHKKSGDREAQE